MDKAPIIQEAERFVKKMLSEQLTEDHQYHNLAHTLAVRTACVKLGALMQLPEEELEILSLAALFHDTGFIEVYNGHEVVSHRLARKYLEERNYPAEKLRKVLSCIDVTFMANRPETELERIIRDADLINLGSDGYVTHLEGLRHEWEVFLGQKFDDADWYKMNHKFLKGQDFFTDAARQLYGPKLKKNISNLKKMAKAAKEERQREESGSSMQGNKSAQMMFKTSLRNHLDLSTLADNKANIMLSVNALILTIVVPIAASNIQEEPWLLAPSLFLLVTCLISMIYATLATRPIKMRGETSDSDISGGTSNLFFFGNFYKMEYKAYKNGILRVIEKDEDLEDSIMRDLFFLGKSLGRKYFQLRICYTAFMIGIGLTVIAFIISYSYYTQALG